MGSNYFSKRHMYSDEQLVDCYLKYMSQNKASAELGVSRETVARAVRRKGIPLTGRKHHGKTKHGGTPEKISNEDLARESKILTCGEIAKKYGMSPERVFRRARNLGIKLMYKSRGGHWGFRASVYGSMRMFDTNITLKKVYDKFDGVCQLCGEKTDWEDVINGHIRKNYPTVDHVVPLSKGGTHTWDNVQLAHMACNSKKHDKLNSGT